MRVKVSLMAKLRSMLNALDQARVDYALVGGMAVAVWGAPRATRDIDLLVRSEDLARAMGAVREYGFSLAALPFDSRTEPPFSGSTG